MVACTDFFEMSEICRPKFIVRHSTVGGQKNWDTQNFLRLYQALNCQNKFKIKLTFTITVDSYLVRYNAKSNRITKTRN
jgi:hypothetical protein